MEDGTSMSSRAWRWVTILAVLAALDLGLTIRAHANFHQTPGGPTVMPVTQLLGWASSAVLLIAVVLVVVGGVREERRRRDRYGR
jgi:hypothetical protein